ncbi:hypothetical protein [Pseudomonas sp. NPDC096925]|uniref:hypothetical protein n=1 Tax=Pseudomonas sp. NPDC096925 TaxID=3364484 RepID=UPI00383A3FEE
MAVSVVAKFIADEWFKIMAVLSFVALVLSMTVDLKVDNGVVGLFSLAGLLWGIGEMASRPFVSGIAPHPYQLGSVIISGRPRRVTKSGIAFFVLSALVSLLGGLKAYPLIAEVVRAAQL